MGPLLIRNDLVLAGVETQDLDGRGICRGIKISYNALAFYQRPQSRKSHSGIERRTPKPRPRAKITTMMSTVIFSSFWRVSGQVPPHCLALLLGVFSSHQTIAGLVGSRDRDAFWHPGADHRACLRGRLGRGLPVQLLIVPRGECFGGPRHFRPLSRARSCAGSTSDERFRRPSS